MALPNVITWKGEEIYDSNPWNLPDLQLDNILNYEVAMGFIAGMTAPDLNLRTSSLFILSDLVSRFNKEPEIQNAFGYKYVMMTNGIYKAMEYGDKYSVRYSMSLLANLTSVSTDWNKYQIETQHYGGLLPFITQVTHDSHPTKSCAMAYGNMALDSGDMEDKWEYQLDFVETLQQITDKIKNQNSQSAVETIMWAIGIFLFTNKPNDRYSRFITAETIKLATHFNFGRSVKVYQEMANGLLSHSCLKVLSIEEAQAVARRVTFPLRHGWSSSYLSSTMKILTELMWCFRNNEDEAKTIIPKSVIKALHKLSPHHISDELQDSDKSVDAIIWITMFYLKYFRVTNVILPNAIKFIHMTLEIGDDDINKSGVFALTKMIELGNESQVDTLQNVENLFMTLSEQYGKHSQTHDQLIDEATYVLLFGKQ